jgi:hypothetical protein
VGGRAGCGSRRGFGVRGARWQPRRLPAAAVLCLTALPGGSARAVTLSTPHDGYLTEATIGTFCKPVTVECDEFAGDSPLMSDLIA